MASYRGFYKGYCKGYYDAAALCCRVLRLGAGSYRVHGFSMRFLFGGGFENLCNTADAMPRHFDTSALNPQPQILTILEEFDQVAWRGCNSYRF